ncbi:unnamed protein product [Paramecium sonneborni]|uniref:Uncharacterized protein n=1 Tax=Paramecium sonneborni TaxID=65129 RepID=A0A8S1RD42_9CILI|nr:unnamed protein product [Paramecium sonneborni]
MKRMKIFLKFQNQQQILINVQRIVQIKMNDSGSSSNEENKTEQLKKQKKLANQLKQLLEEACRTLFRQKHHYSGKISNQINQYKIVRLAQEFDDMSHTNEIFKRADKELVDVMKALVMNAKEALYAYPNAHLKIQFINNWKWKSEILFQILGEEMYQRIGIQKYLLYFKYWYLLQLQQQVRKYISIKLQFQQNLFKYCEILQHKICYNRLNQRSSQNYQKNISIQKIKKSYRNVINGLSVTSKRQHDKKAHNIKSPTSIIRMWNQGNCQKIFQNQFMKQIKILFLTLAFLKPKGQNIKQNRYCQFEVLIILGKVKVPLYENGGREVQTIDFWRVLNIWYFFQRIISYNMKKELRKEREGFSVNKGSIRLCSDLSQVLGQERIAIMNHESGKMLQLSLKELKRKKQDILGSDYFNQEQKQQKEMKMKLAEAQKGQAFIQIIYFSEKVCDKVFYMCIPCPPTSSEICKLLLFLVNNNNSQTILLATSRFQNKVFLIQDDTEIVNDCRDYNKVLYNGQALSTAAKYLEDEYLQFIYIQSFIQLLCIIQISLFNIQS